MNRKERLYDRLSRHERQRRRNEMMIAGVIILILAVYAVAITAVALVLSDL